MNMNNVNNEQLITSFIDMYKTDPTKYDFIISEGKKKYFNDMLAHQMSTNSNNSNTNNNKNKNNNNKKQIISIPTEYNDMDYFSEQLTVALNHARTNPATFITNYLEKHLKKFVDDFIYEEDVLILTTSALNPNINTNTNNNTSSNTTIEKRKIQTKEGKTAVFEAIQYMKQLPSPCTLPLLHSNKYLILASMDHCRDIGPRGSVEHAVSS